MTRICPLCLQGDLSEGAEPPDCAVFQRTVWTLRSLRRCHVHGVMLVPIASAGDPGRLHDFAACVGSEVDRIEALAEAVRHRPMSTMEEYLLARLENTTTVVPFLDGMAWHGAASTCETLGAVALYGRKVPFGRLSEDQWASAGDAGFAIAAEGPGGVTALLSHFDTNYARERSSTEGPQALYGSLHRRLHADRFNDTFEPLRRIMAGHVLTRYPVGPTDLIFGEPFEERRLHSIRSASLEYNIHPKRLRKILLAKGTIATVDETDERTVFDAGAADALLRQAANSKSLTEAETYLNAGRVQTKLLFEAGFIQPFVTVSAIKTTEYNFAKDDLDAFIARLTSRAETVAVEEGLNDIPSAAKRANCSAVEIVDMILAGGLEFVGRRDGQSGYLALRVKVDEVKAKIHGVRPEGYTARELEKELRTTTKVVRALIDSGHLPSQEFINPVNRCPLHLVDKKDVDAFRSAYISLHDLARDRGLHFRRLKAELDEAAIHPALNRTRFGATFYRRADVATP